MAKATLNQVRSEFGIEGRIVSFSLQGPILPPLWATTRVAAAFRLGCLAAFQTLTGSRDSFILSGHNQDASPDNAHRHAYFLPTPDERGVIRGLAVVLPSGSFSDVELVSVQRVEAIRWNGPSTQLRVCFETDRSLTEMVIGTRWVSQTPYIPYRRFWGSHGKKHLAPDKQFCVEFESRVGTPCQVESIEEFPEDVVVRVGSLRAPEGPAPVRLRRGFRLTIRSVQPMRGPLVLGHSAHFGLGQFRPA